MDKNQVLAMSSMKLDDNLNFITNASVSNFGFPTSTTDNVSCWHYWQDYYYPQVIHPSYPVYIRERAEDKGKAAFEMELSKIDGNLEVLKKEESQATCPCPN